MTMYRLNGVPANVRALPILQSASGSIASFNTDLTDDLVEVICQIVAQQASGTPTPVSPLSITGFSQADIVNMSDITNKSFFDGLLNGTYGFVDMGSLNWSGTGDTYFNVAKSVIGAKTVNDINMLCSYYETTSGGGDKTIYDTTNAIRVQDTTYETATDFANAMQGVYLIYELATPTTPTITPEQFTSLCSAFGITGNLYTVAFGQTIYGGEIDVTTGKLTITHEILTLDGTEDWTEYETNKFLVNNVIGEYENKVTSEGYLTNQYLFQGNGATASSGINTDKRVYMQARYGRVWIYDTSYSTLTDLTTALTNTPLQIVYPLATPTTIQLDSHQIESIIGTNNIFADTGNTEVKFWMSINKYIGQ